MGEIVNGKRLGGVFGVTPRTVSDWRKAGAPVHKAQARGKDTLYNTAEVFRWLLARDGGGGKDSGTVAARRKLLEIEAARREIHLARERGESVKIDDVLRTWTTRIQACRGRLLGLPSRLAPDCVACSDIREVHKIIQDRIFECLDELAEPKNYEPKGGTT